MRIFLLLAAAVFFFPQLAFAASASTTKRVGKAVVLISVPPGRTRTSAPVSVDILDKSIPDSAVVKSVAVGIGRPTGAGGTFALIRTQSINLRGPGMAAFVSLPWKGAMIATTFTAADLGGEPVPVKGGWSVSYTGQNIGRSFASKSHTVTQLKIEYTY